MADSSAKSDCVSERVNWGGCLCIFLEVERFLGGVAGGSCLLLVERLFGGWNSEVTYRID
jgi:hypothetical protein